MSCAQPGTSAAGTGPSSFAKSLFQAKIIAIAGVAAGVLARVLPARRAAKLHVCGIRH